MIKKKLAVGGVLAFTMGAVLTFWLADGGVTNNSQTSTPAATKSDDRLAREPAGLAIGELVANVDMNLDRSIHVAATNAQQVGQDEVPAADASIEAAEEINEKPVAKVAPSQDIALEPSTTVGKKVWFGSASLVYGFKPQFYASETDNRYGYVALTAGHRFDGYSVSVNVTTLATNEPKQIAVADPTVTLSIPGVLTLPGEVAVGAVISGRPGLSLKSRDEDLYGSLTTGLSATKTGDVLTVGIAARVSHRFQKYTFNRVGVAYSKRSESVSTFLSLALPASTSITGSLAFLKSVPHEGKPSYIFSNGIDVSWAATKAVSFNLGLSHQDSQLTPAGEDNNVFTIYKQNQSEMYVSATYAF